MTKLLIILLTLVLSFPFWLTPSYIRTSDDIFTNIGTIIGSLFIVALLLERFLDVFLTTWRAPKSEKLTLDIKKLEFDILNVKSGLTNDLSDTKKLSDLVDELNKLKHAVMDHKSETRIIALWSGLILGVVISAIGFRVLNSLVDQEMLSSAGKTQLLAFNFFDVFLTGGLLAGGSDGLHKLMEVYRSFTESTTARMASAGT